MSEEEFYRVSHDAKDAPHYTHRAYVVKSPIPEVGEVVTIMDDDKSHLRFLRGWINCELDIETRWSLNTGVFAVDIVLHRNNKNKVKYKVKLTGKLVEGILKAPLNAMGLCDERKRIILYFSPREVNQLYKFYQMKYDIDRYVTDKQISTPGWHVG